MNPTGFDAYLGYAIMLCVAMIGLNLWLVFRRKRSLALTGALIFMVITLQMVRMSVPQIWWTITGFCVFICLVLDVALRSGKPQNGGTPQ